MTPAGVALVALLGVAPSGADPARPQSTTAEALWQGKADGACRIRLDHPGGSVVVQSGDRAPRLFGAAAIVRVNESQVDGEQYLTLATREGAPPDDAPVTLEVPAACDLRIRSTHGAIAIRGPRRGSLEAESVTGEITLWVSPTAAPPVELATSGEISIDFSISIDYFHHQEPAKRGRIEGDTGAPTIRLSSRRGAIRVLKSRLREAQTVTIQEPR